MALVGLGERKELWVLFKLMYMGLDPMLLPDPAVVLKPCRARLSFSVLGVFGSAINVGSLSADFDSSQNEVPRAAESTESKDVASESVRKEVLGVVRVVEGGIERQADDEPAFEAFEIVLAKES